MSRGLVCFSDVQDALALQRGPPPSGSAIYDPGMCVLAWKSKFLLKTEFFWSYVSSAPFTEWRWPHVLLSSTLFTMGALPHT